MAEPAFMSELEAMLQSAATGQGNHKQALERIAAMKQQGPDFFKYCAFLLADANFAETSRQLAAFQIKNSLRNQFCNSAIEVRQCTMQALLDPSAKVRNAACSIVATAVNQTMWDARATVNEIVAQLGANSGDAATVKGCLAALSEIVDENIEILDFNSADAPAITPGIANAVLPFLGHDDSSVQRSALGTVAVLLEQAAMRREGATFDVLGQQVDNMLAYVGGILTNPQAPAKFMQLASQCLYYTLCYSDLVAQHVGTMTNLMIGLAEHPEESVRIEVVTFFKVLVESQMITHLEPSLIPGVLGYLLNCLQYSKMELGMLQESQGNAGVPDKPEDVRPKNFNLRAKRAGDDDEDDDDDDEDVDQWNLRKAAGACLLQYVNHMGDQLLEHVLNDVAARLSSENWLLQESSILALGIMAGGCEGLKQYLASILDRLLGKLEDQSGTEHFLVKGMCLWTLEQNAEYILTDEQSKANNFLPRTISAILAHMTADTKIIQTRALTALDSFASASEEEELVPYLGAILAKMQECFSGYQLKNLYQLFETADTVYQCFGRALASDEHINVMMAPLMSVWSNVPNDSPLIFPFFMALSAACSALGAAIEPMAQGIFERSFAMVEFHVSGRLAAISSGEEMPEHSQEFLVAGLDLLSGLCEALEAGIEPYIHQVGAEKMTQLLSTTGSDVSPEVRQSCFAVLGELCGGCIGFVQSQWGTFAPLIANALEDVDHYTVASNAAWSLSDFLANYSEAQGMQSIQPAHVDGYYQRVVNLLVVEHDSDMRVMRENAAIAAGRLLALDPAVTQRVQVPAFWGEFCKTMSPMRNGPNKEQALRGILPMWTADPGTLAADSAAFLDMLSGLPNNSPQDLRNELKALVGVLKNGIGAQGWQGILGGMAQGARNKLQRNYGA